MEVSYNFRRVDNTQRQLSESQSDNNTDGREYLIGFIADHHFYSWNNMPLTCVVVNKSY